MEMEIYTKDIHTICTILLKASIESWNLNVSYWHFSKLGFKKVPKLGKLKQ